MSLPYIEANLKEIPKRKFTGPNISWYRQVTTSYLLLCINGKNGNKRKKKTKAKIKSFFMILSSKAGRQAFSPIASGRLRYLRACLPFRNNRLVLLQWVEFISKAGGQGGQLPTQILAE